MNWVQSSSSTGTTLARSSVKLVKTMDLENVKVSFTQDDLKYYFEITANSSMLVYDNDYYTNCKPSPLLYKNENFADNMLIEEARKAPYASCTNGQFYTSSNVEINGTTITKQETKYRLSGGSHYDDGSTNIENGDKFYIPNSMRPSKMKTNENYQYAAKYPISATNNGEGVELLKDDSKSDFSSIDGSSDYNYDANMDIKISIEKDYIDDYRYLCFAEAFVYITYKSEGGLNASYEGESYCTNTIDLKEYVNCDHTWKYVIKDKTNHTMTCDKCKWEKDDNHDFKYEYDGLKNNLCICGFNKNVNHHFVYDSDKIDDKIVKLTASSSCVTYANPSKTGYVFNNYENYYKYFEDMINPVFSTTATKLTNTKIGTITTLPTMSDRFSQIFIAKYDPIKYSVVFKANSNLGFDVSLRGVSNLNNISYDTEHNVPIVSHTGYIFKGWSLTSGSSTVNIKITDKIKNLTTTNAKTINAYPVFAKNKYTFKFATVSNISKINITQNIANLTCEYGTKYYLPNNIEVKGYIFKGWTIMKGSDDIDFNPKAEIFNYTETNNQSITLYPIYKPIKYSVLFNEESNFKFKIDLSGISNLKDIEYDISYDVPIAAYTGYTFKGWSFTLGSSEVDITDKIENLTSTNGTSFNVYPVFDKNKYIFKYATKSNVDKIIITNVIEDLVCEYDTKYNLANNIEVVGYNFIGWSLTRGSDKVDFNNKDEIFNYTDENSKTIIIYPIYKPIKYIFKYSNDNVNNIMLIDNIEDEEFIYDAVEKELYDATSVRGYNFLGWSLSNTSSKIDFSPKQKIFNYTHVDNKEFILYPVYEPLKINIVYNTNLGNFNVGNQLATISYIVNDMKDFDYPTVDPNKKYNRWGELYQSDYLEFSGYKLNDKVFTDFNEFKEYILDRNIQNDNIILVYNGEVKNKFYKVEHDDYDNDDDYVDLQKGPLKPAAQEIIFSTSELEPEIFDNTLSYMYIDESTYAINTAIATSASKKKIDKKEKEVIEEETEVEIEVSEQDDSGEIKATLSIANKWNDDKIIQSVSKMEMLLMIIRENKIQFIVMSALLLIILVAYEIIVYKTYRNRKKV